jgi:hypothetical protein
MGHQIRQRGHPLPERWGVGQPREALPEPLVLGLHLGHALPEDVEGDRRRGPLPLASSRRQRGEQALCCCPVRTAPQTGHRRASPGVRTPSAVTSGEDARDASDG